MPVPVRVTLMETLAEMEYTNQQMVGLIGIRYLVGGNPQMLQQHLAELLLRSRAFLP